MTKIKNEQQYKVACERLEELLAVVSNDTPTTDKNFIEMDLLANLVADYEEEHYPVAKPSLPQAIRYRMAEMNINQLQLAALIGVSSSRISDYLNGKSEPTLKVARNLSRQLNINPAVVLGV